MIGINAVAIQPSMLHKLCTTFGTATVPAKESFSSEQTVSTEKQERAWLTQMKMSNI